MNPTLSDVVHALDFAAQKHRDQRRKGVTSEPYINHLTEVAWLVAETTEGKDVICVIGALLHDTVEDTETTQEELEREFGLEVANLVAELTDDKLLPKPERKRLQIENSPSKSWRAQLVKIADKTSNLRSIRRSPPADWSATRKREYFEWASKVVAGCRGVNATLEAKFDEAYEVGISHIEGCE